LTLFAEIKNGIVVRVIVCEKQQIKKYSGTWIETKKNNYRKQYAGIGMSYDKTKDKFISKQPYNSWTLNKNNDWKSPNGEPPTNKHTWNENDLTWEKLH